MMPEQHNAQAIEQGMERPLPAVQGNRSLVPVGQKIKYSSATGTISLFLAGAIGLHEFSIVVAALVGGGTWLFSEEISARWAGRLPVPEGVGKTLKEKRDWWFGRSSTPDAELELHSQAELPQIHPQAPLQGGDFSEDSLYLGETFCPDADLILSNRVAILGLPGGGKTNTVTVIAEELASLGVPLIIFDTEDEYKPLCTEPYFRRPFLADAECVSLGIAEEFGRLILEEGLQVVLNLQSFENDDEAALVMIAIIKGMQAWEEALPNSERVPCAIILDEAAVWLPQNLNEAVVSRTKDEEGKSVLDKLHQIFFSMVVRRGRKRGIGFVLATQRPAEVDKRAISSAQWKILHQQNMPNDLAVYAQLGVDKDQAQALAQGQAFIIGPRGFKEVHQFRPRNSPDESKSPGLKNLRKHRYTEQLQARKQGQAPLQGDTPDTPTFTGIRPPVRPDQGQFGGRTVRNNTPSETLPQAQKGVTYARNAVYADPGTHDAASEVGVSTLDQGVNTVTPSGWDAEKLSLLPGLYAAFGSLDKCLERLELSTSQKNREFAKALLKQQGLWKDK